MRSFTVNKTARREAVLLYLLRIATRTASTQTIGAHLRRAGLMVRTSSYRGPKRGNDILGASAVLYAMRAAGLVTDSPPRDQWDARMWYLTSAGRAEAERLLVDRAFPP